MTPHGYFGAARPLRHGIHMGVDLVADDGAPVLSATLGKVARTGFDQPVAEGGGGGGNYVIVSTGGYELGYMHLTRIDVQAGDQVQAGAELGTAGASGTADGAAHLHFQVRQIVGGGARYIDPTADLGIESTAPKPPTGGGRGGGLVAGLLFLFGLGWLLDGQHP